MASLKFLSASTRARIVPASLSSGTRIPTLKTPFHVAQSNKFSSLCVLALAGHPGSPSSSNPTPFLPRIVGARLDQCQARKGDGSNFTVLSVVMPRALKDAELGGPLASLGFRLNQMN